MRYLLVVLGWVCLLQAQIGYPGGGNPRLPGQTPYPGGPYPGSPYPGGPYPGGPYPGQDPVPRTGRGGNPKGKGTSNPTQPLPNFRGRLKQMDAKTLRLELDDFRVLEFRVTGKTKYFKGTEELKSPQFHTGDQLMVEGSYDAASELTAVNVYWEKAAEAAPQGQKNNGNDDGVVDTWKDKDKLTEAAPPPAAPDPDDPGPPKLRRGKPGPEGTARASGGQRESSTAPEKTQPSQAASKNAPAKTEAPKQVAVNLPPNTVPLPPPTVTAEPKPHPTPPTPASPDTSPNLVNLPPTTVSLPRPRPQEEQAAANPPEEKESQLDESPLGSHQEDPLIRKAMEAALEFTETLPNYMVQEMVARFQSDSKPASWHAVDVVTTDVVYENGKEDYRNIKVNGKPASKSLEETGAWSTGEFGTLLIDLFSPATAAEFRPRGTERIAGIDAKVYGFQVKRENSHWNLHFASQTYRPAYSGKVWIDPKTARVLRIEMQALGLPQGFPADQVESATDYQHVQLGGTQRFLLPVHAEVLVCQQGGSECNKNTIDFRNYHKYVGESEIQFGGEAPEGTAKDSSTQAKRPQ